MCGWVAYAVMVEGETNPAGRPSRISTKYFAYSAAWSDVPRAASSTNRGGLCGNFGGNGGELGAPGQQGAPQSRLLGDIGRHQLAGRHALGGHVRLSPD